MKKGLIDRLTDPGKIGIQEELLSMPEQSMQSSYRTIFLNLIGYIAGFLLLKNRFDDWTGCFLWYLLLPVMFNITSVCLVRAYTYYTAGKDSEFYSSYKYIIPGALIYSFTYCNVVVIYRSIPPAWILIFMPVILACYFKGMRWFYVQTAIQGLFFLVMLLTRTVETPFDVDADSPVLKGLFFAMVMLQFVHAIYGGDTLKRSIYAGMSAEEARMEVRRVFEANLSDDCKPYLGSIEDAADKILARDEVEKVHEYAERLKTAAGALREAIGEEKTQK